MKSAFSKFASGITFGLMALALVAVQIPLSSGDDATTTVVVPTSICGDSVIGGGETCDDGNTNPGDGCDGACMIEPGYVCSGQPSVCTECGNGLIEGSEECDDGNTSSSDGCSNACVIEVGYICLSEPSICSICGNGVVDGLEQCDDGNTISGDGCSNICRDEGGSPPPPQEIVISEVLAYPEQRTGLAGSNYDTDFVFSILTSGTHGQLYEHATLLSSNNNGIAPVSVTLPGSILPGTYDAAIKTKAHLRKIVSDVSLVVGVNALNFTNATNLPTVGTVQLVAGDVNGLGANPQTLGDDVINSVDLSILLNELGSSDVSGNGIRSNLNQDNTVDQIDLNILLGNLDLEGDQ